MDITEAETKTRRAGRVPALERRAHLIRVGREAFLTLGADGASMQKIADLAEVNSAILYRHFRSNVELFEEAILLPLEQQVLEWIEEAQRRPASEIADPVLELHVGLLNLMVDTAPVIGVVLFADKFPGRQFYSERIEPPLKRWLEKRVKQLGAVRKGTVSPRMLASALLGAHMSVALDAHLRGEVLNRRRVARLVKDVFSFGLFDQSGARRG